MEELYRKFHKTVLQMAWKLNPQDAEDIAQNAWVRVISKIGQLRNKKAFPGWVKQIVRRLIKKKRPLLELQEDVIDSRPGPEEIAMQKEEAQKLHERIVSLGVLDRQVIDLFYMRHLSIKEIAAYLNVPVGTVKRRLHVARGRLAA